MTARPIGPQPSTSGTSPAAVSTRLSECSATAMGSVSAATSVESSSGTGISSASLRSIRSAYAPGTSAPAKPISTGCSRSSMGIATTRVPTGSRCSVSGP